MNHGRWVTESMRFTPQVLKGHYLGDVAPTVYERARIREQPDILEACFALGREAVIAMRELTPDKETE